MIQKNEPWRRWLLMAGLSALILTAIWCEVHIHRNSAKREQIKYDSSIVNSLTYGLLSVDVWKENIQGIISKQITDFDFTKEQDSTLKRMVTNMLDSLLIQADNMIQRSDTTFKKKLMKLAVNAFVDVDDLRKQTPQFSKTIVESITAPENKERLKKIALEKVNDFAATTYDDADSVIYADLLQKYEVNNHADFTTKTEALVSSLGSTTYRYTYAVLAIMALFLLLWIPLYRHTEFRIILFVFSVLLVLTVLICGISVPMMEIDARMTKVDFVLLGQHIEFNNQILFYKSKSILQVVVLLLQTGEADSVVVGFLILLFSVIMPLAKLISTQIYLAKQKLRKNKFFYWLAMKSGKWSMADVMVIAITMTYVGLSGIVDNQLEILNMETESLTSITTNLTCLLPGFVLFLAFVVFGLILGNILKRITPEETTVPQ